MFTTYSLIDLSQCGRQYASTLHGAFKLDGTSIEAQSAI